MKITGVSVLSTIAVILHSFTTTEASHILNQCATHHDCATWNACFFGFCDNTCDYASQGSRATCEVNDHVSKFTCTYGYEFPKDTDIELCLPMEWACHGNKQNPAVINCDAPSWICLEVGSNIACGAKEKVIGQLINHISFS